MGVQCSFSWRRRHCWTISRGTFLLDNYPLSLSQDTLLRHTSSLLTPLQQECWHLKSSTKIEQSTQLVQRPATWSTSLQGFHRPLCLLWTVCWGRRRRRNWTKSTDESIRSVNVLLQDYLQNHHNDRLTNRLPDFMEAIQAKKAVYTQLLELQYQQNISPDQPDNTIDHAYRQGTRRLPCIMHPLWKNDREETFTGSWQIQRDSSMGQLSPVQIWPLLSMGLLKLTIVFCLVDVQPPESRETAKLPWSFALTHFLSYCLSLSLSFEQHYGTLFGFCACTCISPPGRFCFQKRVKPVAFPCISDEHWKPKPCFLRGSSKKATPAVWKFEHSLWRRATRLFSYFASNSLGANR